MGKGRSEKAVSTDVALTVSRLGGRVGRNNVGIARYVSEKGKPYTVSYGVFGEGASDWLGVMPVTITPEMVGRTVGVMLVIETKRQRGGKVSPKQRNFLDRMTALGAIVVLARSGEDVERGIKEWRG